MKQAIPATLIGVGFLLLALSTYWVQIAPPTSYWNDEDVVKLEEMNQRIVQIYHQLAPAEAQELEARLGKYDGPLTPYEVAVEKRNEFRSQRDIAMTRPKQIAATLRWSGLGTLAVGAMVFYVLQQLGKNA